jgi:hypothetical protein
VSSSLPQADNRPASATTEKVRDSVRRTSALLYVGCVDG